MAETIYNSFLQYDTSQVYNGDSSAYDDETVTSGNYADVNVTTGDWTDVSTTSGSWSDV